MAGDGPESVEEMASVAGEFRELTTAEIDEAVARLVTQPASGTETGRAQYTPSDSGEFRAPGRAVSRRALTRGDVGALKRLVPEMLDAIVFNTDAVETPDGALNIFDLMSLVGATEIALQRVGPDPIAASAASKLDSLVRHLIAEQLRVLGEIATEKPDLDDITREGLRRA